ncbi:MAG: DNA-directed RNA polymerase subunit alpha [Nitrospiraceae bacterium]|nr:DNA-directed RNA polymerase subunit alpha [Nitrospiraceae bacterium]
MWNLNAIKFAVEKEDNNYGEYSLGPLESGYGLTLGTALRRILLASIEGVAPIGITIDGVVHEFSTIDGVVEDMEEIILNVKKLIVSIDGEDNAKLSFNVKGEKELKASDLQHSSEVSILNPDLHIATISSSKAHLSGEIYLKRGRGYKLEEEIAEEEHFSQLVIPIDAYFSPVLKVNFHIEPMRFEESVNFDKLIVGILAKGNKTPLDAMSEAVEISINYLTRFSNLLSVDVAEDDSVSEEYKDMDLKTLEIGKRSLNALKNNNINTVGDLLEYREDGLLKLKHFGETSLKKVKESLKKLNLKLKE